MKILAIFLLFLTSVSKDSTLTYDKYVELSYKYLENNDLNASEYALKEAMKKEPGNPGNTFLLSNLGTIQRQQGKLEEALISYTASLGRSPYHLTFLSNRASLLVELNRPEEAIMDYTTLLDHYPTNEEALYQRGMLYLQIRNYEAAQTDFERIVELNPNSLTGRLGIASLCKFRNEYDEAEKIYHFLIDKLPGKSELYAGRAELYLLMGKTGQAIGDINKALTLDNEKKDAPYLYMLRARGRLLLSDKKEAKSDIEKAMTLGYDSVAAQELLKLCK
jgi:Tfp pilus assembly protein PilF